MLIVCVVCEFVEEVGVVVWMFDWVLLDLCDGYVLFECIVVLFDEVGMVFTCGSEWLLVVV